MVYGSFYSLFLTVLLLGKLLQTRQGVVADGEGLGIADLIPGELADRILGKRLQAW